jgi:hypothetical protein
MIHPHKAGLLAMLCLLPALPRAGSEGTAGASFLEIPVSTRASAMGGALSAKSDDLSAMDFNPSRLDQLDGSEATLGHLAYIGGITVENVALGYGWSHSGLGLSYISLASPEIAGLDAQDQPIASFSLHDSATALGYGVRLGRFELGLTGRLVTQSLAGFNSTGFGADLGSATNLGAGFSLALVAQNLGSLSAVDSVADPMPTSYRGGLGWKGEIFQDGTLLVEADAVLPSDSTLEILGGAELDYRSAFFIRVGGQYSQAFDSQQNFSAGAGFRFDSIQLDYSYVPYSALGSAQRASLSVFISALMHPEEHAAKHRGLGRPLNVSLAPTKGGMDISWEPPSGASAAGYAVYVRAGSDAELKRVNPKPLTHLRLHLKAALGDREYGFAVAAIDADGNEGERSDEVKFRPGSSQKLGPPEPPRHLKALRKGSMIYLRWDKALSPGSLRYQVYISARQGSAYAPVHEGETGATELQWKPEALKSSSAYLVVRTLRQDQDGTAESDFSEEVSVSVK